jgi:hypothetical protein
MTEDSHIIRTQLQRTPEKQLQAIDELCSTKENVTPGTQVKDEPFFFVGARPVGLVCHSQPADRPFRVGVQGWTVVAMPERAFFATVPLCFKTREMAEQALEHVRRAFLRPPRLDAPYLRIYELEEA